MTSPGYIVYSGNNITKAIMDGTSAGGALSGTFPNPSVNNDSHNHNRSTLPEELVSIILGTRLDILSTAPTYNKIGFSTDTGKFFMSDGSSWFQLDIALHEDTGINIGYSTDNAQSGYGKDFITDKILANCIIGSSSVERNGSLRVNQSESPNTLEIYMRSDDWFTLIYDMTIEDAEFRHVPVAEKIRIWSGNSLLVGLNGRPIVNEYVADMGCYPAPRTLHGGIF